jgi:ADP-ribose pyrophosphatase YjhB (NUDIX family)
VNFCSHCGSRDLQFIVPKGDNRSRYCCETCGTIHYQNPRMVVGCLPVWEGQILLCRRAIEPRSGYWNLPAGYLENGETTQAGAIRETLEESGAAVEIVRPHCLYHLPQINQVYLFFLAQMHSADLDIGPESLEARLFAPAEIPYEDMAFTSSTFAIHKYLEFRDTAFHGVHVGEYWHPR